MHDAVSRCKLTDEFGETIENSERSIYDNRRLLAVSLAGGYYRYDDNHADFAFLSKGTPVV